MIPTLYKRRPADAVLHVAARTVATMRCRSSATIPMSWPSARPGAPCCAPAASEAQDFALISHIATLQSRVPFIHFLMVSDDAVYDHVEKAMDDFCRHRPSVQTV